MKTFKLINCKWRSTILLRQEHLFLPFTHVEHSDTGSIKWSHGVEFPDTEGVLGNFYLVARKVKHNSTISVVNWC